MKRDREYHWPPFFSLLVITACSLALWAAQIAIATALLRYAGVCS